jgi:hypothetical protein
MLALLGTAVALALCLTGLAGATAALAASGSTFPDPSPSPAPGAPPGLPSPVPTPGTQGAPFPTTTNVFSLLQAVLASTTGALSSPGTGSGTPAAPTPQPALQSSGSGSGGSPGSATGGAGPSPSPSPTSPSPSPTSPSPTPAARPTNSPTVAAEHPPSSPIHLVPKPAGVGSTVGVAGAGETAVTVGSVVAPRIHVHIAMKRTAADRAARQARLRPAWAAGRGCRCTRAKREKAGRTAFER